MLGSLQTLLDLVGPLPLSREDDAEPVPPLWHCRATHQSMAQQPDASHATRLKVTRSSDLDLAAFEKELWVGCPVLLVVGEVQSSFFMKAHDCACGHSWGQTPEVLS